MFFSKNGQGMPINVIVIAVLALIALVVIGWIFSTQSGRFSQGLNSCEAKKGTCMDDKDDKRCASNETVLLTPGCKYVGTTTDQDKDGQCCIPIFG